jgi:hypothetical protein
MEKSSSNQWFPLNELTFIKNKDPNFLKKSRDSFIYGTWAQRVSGWAQLSNRMFILLPDNKSILQWISEKKMPVDSRIKLDEVSRLLFGLSEETKRLNTVRSQLKAKKIPESFCLSIFTSDRYP